MYVKRTALRKFDTIAHIIKSEKELQSFRGKKIFTRAELDYCGKRLRCLGARFIIKECVFDYIEDQIGYVEKNYEEIEIINNELKKPGIRLFNGINQTIKKMKITDMLISISHSRNWIMGMVVFCY